MKKEFLLNTSDGVKLQGYTWEPEDKGSVRAVVVIIHGLGEHTGRYDEYARHFASKGLAVFSMDLRGHGRSPGKRGHTSPRCLILSDIDALCQEAATKYPNLPLFIYGHSMGGNLGLNHRLEGAFRPRGYIITSPWIWLCRKVSPIQVKALRLLSRIKPDVSLDNGIKASDITSVESERNYGDPLTHRFVSVSTVLDCHDASERILKASHEALGQMLLLHGDQDNICSIEGSRAFMRKAPEECTYREWPGCRHELQHEKDKEMVRDTILDWILARV